MPELDEFKYPAPEDVEFERESALAFYKAFGTVNPTRWERVRTDVFFSDVVEDLTGKHGSSISCPFHGRDSRPSFWIYRGSNDGWCFGCPPREQYYDSVRFVSKMLGISRVQALRWIEKKFELPALPDVILEDEADEVISEITFQDLSEPYIALASRDVQANKNAELAEEYLRLFFQASTLNEKDTSPEEKAKGALLLSEVLGREVLKRIRNKKAY